VRPVRWVVALLDSAIVPVEIAGMRPAMQPGHRILHGEAPVVLDSPKSYAEALRKAFAVVDVSSAAVSFARLSMRQRALFPERAGARTRRWLKPSFI